MVFAKHQCELVTDIHVSPPTWAHLPDHPIPLGCHGTLAWLWVSCFIHWTSTGHLFYIWQCTCFMLFFQIVPHSPIDNSCTIDLSHPEESKTPIRWKILTACRPQAPRPQTSWNKKTDDCDSKNIILLTYHQSIRIMAHNVISQLWPSLLHCL